MDGSHIRNFKDFLLLYNQISETCFKRCANTFMSREITSEEDECVANCAQKHIHANHKIMQVYMEVQPVLIQKKVDEMNSMQAAMEEQAKAQAQSQIQSEGQIAEENVRPRQSIEQAVQ